MSLTTKPPVSADIAAALEAKILATLTPEASSLYSTLAVSAAAL